MKNVLRVSLVLVSAVLLSGAAAAQQAVPPPPRPVPDGPTLTATMQFIQTKLQERGRLNFAVYTHDNADGKDYIDQYSGEPTNFLADASTCKISYHRDFKKNGTVLADSDFSFSLHDVRDLVVLPADQEMKREYAAAGHPTWDARVEPAMFLVVAREAGNQSIGFYFLDEDISDRVAKAMVHAVELCGGGNKDPF